MDSNNRYSNVFVKSITVEDIITFNLEEIEYKTKNGMTLQEWLESKYNTFGYNFSYIKNKGNERITTKDTIITNNNSYNIYDNDFKINEVMDSNGNTIEITKPIYTEKYQTYNPDIDGSLLYDKEKMNEIAKAVLNTNKEYSVSLPFTLMQGDTTSITYPLQITFESLTTNNTYILLHYVNGSWQAEDVVLSSNKNSFTVTLTSLTGHDPFVILYA